MLTLLFLALTVQGALLFGGRRRRFDVVTLVLGGTQFGLHNAFHFLAAPQPVTHGHHLAGASGGHAMHADSGHAMDGGSGHVMDTGMTLAHAAATLGTALCVIHGERVLRRLAALLAPLLALRPAPPLPCLPRLRRVPPVVTRIRFGALLARSRHRRGPPSAALA
ncbi:hypothetical protein RI138_03495 [Streptomyces sp. C11-1]|uniref:Uncharacterized protein n=1 Tax=Streptomyces durocortorensis TaxID=2811104 RepID=A0ABY9W5W8_9ACTN|nr:hypothetical protein [Streptomyces durocortorensis]WNF31163.1 hypothetical protein RI138_03495 [Streptomyces durocortorensis]